MNIHLIFTYMYWCSVCEFLVQLVPGCLHTWHIIGVVQMFIFMNFCKSSGSRHKAVFFKMFKFHIIKKYSSGLWNFAEQVFPVLPFYKKIKSKYGLINMFFILVKNGSIPSDCTVCSLLSHFMKLLTKSLSYSYPTVWNSSYQKPYGKLLLLMSRNCCC